MSDMEIHGKPVLRFIGTIWITWLAASAVLLLAFSFLLDRTAGSERTMAYLSSALCFLAACAAGAQAARMGKGRSVWGGLLCAVLLLLPLIVCGFLLDRKAMSPDSVLSLASLSLAGSLFGSVFLCARTKKRGKHHTRLSQTRKRRS